MDCTICVGKTKALICTFVFAYAKSGFYHDAAHIKCCVFCNIYTSDCLPLNTFIKQLSSFADEEICPREMRFPVTSLVRRINNCHDWST